MEKKCNFFIVNEHRKRFCFSQLTIFQDVFNLYVKSSIHVSIKYNISCIWFRSFIHTLKSANYGAYVNPSVLFCIKSQKAWSFIRFMHSLIRPLWWSALWIFITRLIIELNYNSAFFQHVKTCSKTLKQVGKVSMFKKTKHFL